MSGGGTRVEPLKAAGLLRPPFHRSVSGCLAAPVAGAKLTISLSLVLGAHLYDAVGPGGLIQSTMRCLLCCKVLHGPTC